MRGLDPTAECICRRDALAALCSLGVLLVALLVLAEPALAVSPREYHGVDAVVDDGPTSSGRQRSGPPVRPTVEDVFIDEKVPGKLRSKAPTGLSAVSRVSAGAGMRDSLEPRRTGLALLVAGGVIGTLAGLSRLPVIVVGSAHVQCVGDPSLDALAPCGEQAVGHKVAYVSSLVLFVGAVPMLAVGGTVRGRFLTQHERAGHPLSDAKVRRRLGTGIPMIVAGAALFATSLAVGTPVAFERCTSNCRVGLVLGEASWWAGSAAIGGGTTLVAHTLGRRRPNAARPRGAKPFVTAAGLGIAGRF